MLRFSTKAKRFCSSSIIDQYPKDSIQLLRKVSKIKEITPFLQTAVLSLSIQNKEYNEINDIISSGEANSEFMNDIRTKIGRLEVSSLNFQELTSIIEDYFECDELSNENPDDVEVKEMVKDELLSLESRVNIVQEKIIESMLIPEKFEDYDEARVEFRPGMGGVESQLFANEMLEVYQVFCQANGWKVIDDSIQRDGTKGLKFASFKVKGEGCFKRLKSESGVHK